MFWPVLYKFCLILCLSNMTMSRILEFREVHTNFNPKHYRNFSLSIRNNTISMDFVTARPIVAGFQVLVDFQFRVSKGKAFQSLFSYNMDVCRLVKSVKNSFFKRWFVSFRKYGNFLASCPMKEGYYYMHDWECDGAMVPTYLYGGDYRIISSGYFGKHKSKNEDYVFDALLMATLV